MPRRLIALIAAFVLPIVLAYVFFEFARSVAPPALRSDDPQILSFVPWCLPLAFLCSWIAKRGWAGAHAGSGLVGAVLGGMVGFVYFWALLITTNGMFLGFPFSVVGAWTIGASLALMLASTPAKPLAWVIDAVAVAGIYALVHWQVSIELQPKRVLAVLFRPGTTAEQVAKEKERSFMIDTVNGKDFAPGVFQMGEASAGPEGVHFSKVQGVDTTGIAVVFSPRATETQRAEVVQSALASPLVARVVWAPPGFYEKEQARLATDANIGTEGRVTGNP